MTHAEFEAHAEPNDPQYESTDLLIERALIAEGRCEEALLRLSYVVRAQPRWAEPYGLVAQALSMRSHFTEALVAAEQSVALDPSNYFVNKLRAGLLLQTGRYQAALQASSRLIALDPDNAEGHAFEAFAHAFNQDEARALASAKRCKQVAPKRGYGHQAYCVVHLAFQRWEKAAHHARQALALEGPVASVYHDLGVALWEMGRLDQATDALVEAARMDSRYKPALARMHTRNMSDGAPAFPSMFALAAGVALMPLVQAPRAIATVVIACVIACVVAAMSANGVHAARRWAEVLRPALFVVFLFDLGLVMRQTGMF